jgi:hypothetical protein
MKFKELFIITLIIGLALLTACSQSQTNGKECPIKINSLSYSSDKPTIDDKNRILLTFENSCKKVFNIKIYSDGEKIFETDNSRDEIGVDWLPKKDGARNLQFIVDNGNEKRVTNSGLYIYPIKVENNKFSLKNDLTIGKVFVNSASDLGKVIITVDPLGKNMHQEVVSVKKGNNVYAFNTELKSGNHTVSALYEGNEITGLGLSFGGI